MNREVLLANLLVSLYDEEVTKEIRDCSITMSLRTSPQTGVAISWYRVYYRSLHREIATSLRSSQ